MSGDDASAGPAEELVQEILAAGGQAVANTDSVATQDGGKAIIESALDSFGRIDILIHNAGNVRRGTLQDMSYDDFNKVIDVHLKGGFHVVREAFPHMVAQQYGRIVLTSSINGLYGKSNNVNYAMAKAGLIGLSHTAAIEGLEHGIKSNVIVPAAVTRMADGLDTSAYPPMEPEMVAPVVGWMAHEDCSITGEILVAMAGRVARAYVAETPGAFSKDWTVEQIAAEIGTIRGGGDPLIFPPAPDGQLDHLKYGFAVASKQ
jgi:NAD(P)-dependent dehydrogenase (short-subunit alcohol dehydrogenase family)